MGDQGPVAVFGTDVDERDAAVALEEEPRFWYEAKLKALPGGQCDWSVVRAERANRPEHTFRRPVVGRFTFDTIGVAADREAAKAEAKFAISQLVSIDELEARSEYLTLDELD